MSPLWRVRLIELLKLPRIASAFIALDITRAGNISFGAISFGAITLKNITVDSIRASNMSVITTTILAAVTLMIWHVVPYPLAASD